MSQETLSITAKDESSAQAVRDFIDGLPESQTRITSRRNLDGGATVILIATVVGQLLPPILTFIAAKVTERKVTRITVNGITIENPTREDIENLIADIGHNQLPPAKKKKGKTDE